MPIFLRRTPLLIVFLVAILAGGYFFYGSRSGPNTGPSSIELADDSASAVARRGGELTATLRTEPRSFNRFVAPDPATKLVATLTQAPLVRVNQVTQELEPWLAERWETSGTASGARYVVHLRRGLTFSDGEPFTAADVVFTFQALYDPKVASPLAEAYKIDGKPLEVTATDDHTITIAFPAPYGPGLRPLDSLPILPKHKLEAALKDGKFREAWSAATSPAEIAGLGPFVLKTYTPGQRLQLERNAKYWRKDERGETLPYLDRLTIEITPTQAAEMLKFEAGQADLLSSELRPEDIPAARKLTDARKVVCLVTLKPPLAHDRMVMVRREPNTPQRIEIERVYEDFSGRFGNHAAVGVGRYVNGTVETSTWAGESLPGMPLAQRIDGALAGSGLIVTLAGTSTQEP